MALCGGGAAAVLRGLVRVVHMGRLLHRRHRRGRQAGPPEVQQKNFYFVFCINGANSDFLHYFDDRVWLPP